MMRPGASQVPLDRAVLRAAAQWLVRLHSGRATAADHAALAAWREAAPAHDAAWQRAERLSQKFGAVPASLGTPLLTRDVRANRRAVLRTLALLAGTGSASWMGWRLASEQAWLADYRTAAGEQRGVSLADGSVLQLDTASAVDVAFDGLQRVVHLRRGAIFVATAADAQQRPFIVATRLGHLRALGTRFTVRQDDTDAPVHVVVAEGAVEISPANGAASPLILPAQHQTLLMQDGVMPPTPITPATLGWVQGLLHAEDMPLGDFCTELARYRPGVIRCSPEVAGLRISGTFRLRDTDYILSMVASILPVRVLLRTRYWVQLLPA